MAGTIAKNVGLLTAANLLMRGVGMLFQVYLTGQVGAAGVGLLQLIVTVQLFAMTLGTSGLRVAALYLSAEEYGLRRFSGVRQAISWCLGAGLVLSALVGAALAALAFECQMVERVPMAPHDVTMHLVITQRAVYQGGKEMEI